MAIRRMKKTKEYSKFEGAQITPIMAKIMPVVGIAGGLGFAYYRKSKMWGYVGWASAGLVLGGFVGMIISYEDFMAVFKGSQQVEDETEAYYARTGAHNKEKLEYILANVISDTGEPMNKESLGRYVGGLSNEELDIAYRAVKMFTEAKVPNNTQELNALLVKYKISPEEFNRYNKELYPTMKKVSIKPK